MHVLRKYDNAIEAAFWAVQLIPAVYFGYITSISYVSILSVYALVKGCWAAHQAKMARMENGSP